MTIKELIEALCECDADSLVTVSHYDQLSQKWEQMEVSEVIECKDDDGQMVVQVL